MLKSCKHLGLSRAALAVTVMLAAGGLVSCDDDDAGDGGSGGVGASANGGSKANGGTPSKGGSGPSSGGSKGSSGGSGNAGAATNTGGLVGSGGKATMGGVAGVAGKASNGGTPSSGGVSAAGAAGLATPMGGRMNSGGAPTAGSSSGGGAGFAGSTAAGGTTARGGASGSGGLAGVAGMTAGAAGQSAASFSAVYTSILQARCLPCHTNGGGVTSGMLDMSTRDNAYLNLVGANGQGVAAMGTVPGAANTACASINGLLRVDPADAATSLVWQKVNAKSSGATPPCGNPMPPGGAAALTQAELNLLAAWIDAGARND